MSGVEKKEPEPNSMAQVLVFISPPGGAIDPSGALGKSLPVPATPNLFLVTDPTATATGGIKFAAGAAASAAPVYVAPGDPHFTASSTPVMMGLGSAATITPLGSGNIAVGIDLLIANLTSLEDVSIAVRYGTGAAPGNGVAPPAGSVLLTPVRLLTGVSNISPNTLAMSFTPIAIGLTVGTAYWFDIQLAAPSSGDAQISSISVSLQEI